MSSKRKGLITHDTMPWSKGRFYQDLPGFLKKLGSGIKDWWRISNIIGRVSIYAKDIDDDFNHSKWHEILGDIKGCRKTLDQLEKEITDVIKRIEE